MDRSFVTETGVQSRAFNIKDGYALQLAVKWVQCGGNIRQQEQKRAVPFK
jgi:3-deoxy-D-manno-octulosonate 8-phosphate phosphatase KdsC-like HAD superfamily phosphatase